MEGAMFNEVMEVLKRPFVYETFVDLLMCYVPIWVAVIIGLVIGWSWRPRWTGLVFLGLRPNKFRGFVWSIPPGFGARRLWLAFTALSAFPVCRSIWFYFRGKGKQQLGSGGGGAASVNTDDNRTVTESGSGQVIDLAESNIAGPGWRIREKPQEIVNEKDVEHLLHLLEGKDGEATWQRMFERSTPNMACQAWRQEPETGPVVYKSRTVYEDATPELVRDFFWDDEFRPKWDPMLSYFKILEECTQTGSMIVHWIKKFPFFCSDREYIIGRRIWEDGKAYYCVTKGVPYPSLPKRDKPRRVDLYFSSWVIRAVESRKGDGQMSACEVILVHYEDMGIPKDVAKLGVRHGMWGTVKKIHSGMRAYQNARKPGAALSRCALLAGVTTKISFEETADSADHVSEGERGQIMVVERNRKDNGIDWKWVVIGGTVALVCGLHTGVIGRAILIGAGRRIARN